MYTKQCDVIDIDLLSKFKKICEDKGPLKFEHGEYMKAMQHHSSESIYHQRQSVFSRIQNGDNNDWHKIMSEKHMNVANALADLMKHQNKD